jgi:serine/threonine protein kinase
LNFIDGGEFHYTTTIFYRDTIAAAMKENRISNYDIDKMFHQIFDGLDYLKSKKIKHGHIHERNVAYDGKNWFIGGLVEHQRDSSDTITICKREEETLISRRAYQDQEDTQVNMTYGDDLWQVILTFVKVVYNKNPFLSDMPSRYNVTEGICEIFSETEAGLLLREYLIRITDIQLEEYEQVRGLCKKITAEKQLNRDN